MYLARTVAATVAAVSVQDATDHLRVTGTDEAYLIGRLVAAATEAVGEMAGRVMATETWAMSVASASGDLALPKSPVQAVTAISYYDSADTVQAANVADFYLFKDDDKAVLRPKPGKAWPLTSAREDAITVTFTAGYVKLPDALRYAVLLMVGHLYRNREAVGEAMEILPLGVEAHVNIHRLGWAAG